MLSLSRVQKDFLRQWSNAFLNSFQNSVENPISTSLPFYTPPPEIVDFKNRIVNLYNTLMTPAVESAIEIDEHYCPVIKTVVLHQRRELASQLDEPRDRTSHPALLQSFDDRLKPFRDLMDQPWFHETSALQIPRLSDFLALERVDHIFRSRHALLGRQFDEKFHILQSPSLVRSDLKYFREMCGVRGRCVALAYVDIDHFKDLNTKYGESTVDVDVLPIFMREVEASVFFRGFAYREGGDEYIVVLPNVDARMGLVLLDELRLRVEDLKYRNISERITVSIGMCVLDPDCFLTERETEERANRAKNFAKQKGRNCIVTYQGSVFRDADLYVAPKG